MSLPVTSVFNDGYISELFEQYRRDPASVDESWRQYFRFAERLGGGTATGGTSADPAYLRKVAGAAALAAAVRQFGHLAVQIDPLGSPPPGAAELTPAFHGLTDQDLETIPAEALGLAGANAAQAIAALRESYSGALGYEFEHLGAESERNWFRTAIEDGTFTQPLSPDEKHWLLGRLTRVDGLERFLGLAFVNAKRFSIEGLDVMVPMLDDAIATAAALGARVATIGMAHRGRLNVLTQVMGKPEAKLFAEFQGRHDATNSASDTGDVKYHMGFVGERALKDGVTVELQLVPNPSHLEFAGCVMQGVARARQRVAGAAPGTRDEASVLPIVIHGDAAFPGEGIVAETINLSMLRGYRVGGSLHIIANNQVGFTTDPSDSRSTHYSSDVAKGFEVPIVHVNADDAESCIHSMRMAVAYRQRFGKDFLIDLVGYRRHGHNEADQPSFTQPKLYDIIKTHPTPREIYGAKLVRERVLTDEQVQALDKDNAERLQKLFESTKNAPDHQEHPSDKPRSAPPPPVIETAVKSEQLVALNERLLTWPTDFKLHPTLQRTLPRRREAMNSRGIDWGHAEALAFASLLVDGTGIRLTGQDAERGTFSHRQAVLHDVSTGATYTPLANLPNAKAPFEIYNSPLSETAVMGFEYGFSVCSPKDMVLWEAQFGDFANVAQPIMDQFLSADRAKWGQDSGLVLLLPHGYEGQGPEHSSARLERFLQMSAEGNMVVAYPSTPAQYFHVLRRQAMRGERRPLVLMQPKSLLRLPAAASSLDELTSGRFQPVLDDAAATNRDAVKRLVLCSGKVYYDLVNALRGDEKTPGALAEFAGQTALVRVEELYPWPHDELAAVVDRYPNIEEVVWCQEEPKNMGAWSYLSPRLRASTGSQVAIRYVGRPERASPAEGYHDAHTAEQGRIVREALTVASGSKKKAKV